MKKQLVFLFLILSTAFLNVALAQNKRIAILEAIDREDSIPYSVALIVRSNLTKAVTAVPGYEGFDGVNVSEIMDEQEYKSSGLVDEDQIKRLGEMAEADYLLFFEMVRYDETNVFVTAKILNAETAKMEGSENALMSMTPENIQHGCESLTKRLLVLSSRFDKMVQTTKSDIGELVSFPDGTKGVVFYVDEKGRKLVVSLDEGKESWDNNYRSGDIVPLYNVGKGEKYFNYGEGQRNTQAILSALGDNAQAAYWCSLQGKDWYLPSCGELYVLMSVADDDDAFVNALRLADGGEISGWYWSSSERNDDEAWNVKCGGHTSSEEKNEHVKVRAIRTFSGNPNK